VKSSDGQRKKPAPDLVRSFVRFVVPLLWLGQAVLLPGCGSPKSTTTVGGTISLDGLPLDNGAISFYPVDGGDVTAAQSAGATIGKDGRYQAEVAPGRFRVEITSSRVVGQRKAYEDIPDSPMEDILEELIPPQYNTASELVRDVDIGTSTVDFQLTKSKNAPRQP
jgi:hypothetical protein